MRLGVNVDHVATLRQARRGRVPDPIKAAEICERAGCDSIVCHLREDRRHINDRDLSLLRKNVKTKLNLEMSCAEEIVNIAVETRPGQATLVPEKREEITTEGGLDVVSGQKTVSQVVKRLASARIEVSLFIDPEERQIQAAKDCGAKCIELHTGRYADARDAREADREFDILKRSAEFAQGIGLKVFAGHGLNYENVRKMMDIKEVEELNIGHSIIAQAVFSGLENAVRQMLQLIKR